MFVVQTVMEVAYGSYSHIWPKKEIEVLLLYLFFNVAKTFRDTQAISTIRYARDV